MSDAKTMSVRHVQTGQIKKVTEEQRAAQEKNYWVRVTGDVEETKPADVPTGPDATPEPTEGDGSADTKTTSKATAPKK
ncbi:hypothetical protein [Frigoribacterium sp. VKM Ac-2530]|uniref:hypothetical protein n=1 Tax=Frigoribacterium sp. VKM Ac-2530 TaxID=2783822 RepID=UPI00188B0531|nr:hypothetical protein [Frigoribacterium sp. VKM Ac-2530]MBF4578960.1 hypothetical protein [Frigoribacterium sp. VKM Ac-2530]